MAVLYLPTPPKLECDAKGNISFKQMDHYFRTIGSIPNQILLQVDNLPEDCAASIVKIVREINKLIDDVTGFLMTDVFKKLKSKEQELEYKVREFFKEIDVWFQKKIVEILMKIAKLIGLPDPFAIPIPFIGPCEIMGADGKVENFSPTVGDLLTKAGKVKVKACIADDIERVKKFLGIKGKFDGSKGIKSPEHEVEEVWQRIVNWLNKTFNDFIFKAIELIVKALKKIPIIGPIVSKLLNAAIDPTITLEEAMKKIWEEYEKKIKDAIDDVLSGRALENLANKLMDELIDKVLNFPVPLFGTLGKLLGIDFNEEKRKFKVQSKEKLLHKIDDAWKDMMEKIRRFFHGGLIKKINDAILKLPGFILKRFPIVKKIFKAIDAIVKIMTGQNPITICDVINIILKPIFSLATIIYSMIPDCVQIKYTKYGLEPDPLKT